jgi:hypothetical protein
MALFKGHPDLIARFNTFLPPWEKSHFHWMMMIKNKVVVMDYQHDKFDYNPVCRLIYKMTFALFLCVEIKNDKFFGTLAIFLNYCMK